MKSNSIIPLLSLVTCAIHAQEADLAQKLANPISDLISLPIQSNVDFGVGTIWRTNIQPVIPFSISKDCNVISRTILPVVDQEGLAASGDGLDASGLGDQLMQAFVGARYYAEKPAGSPDWGIRMGLTFLFPK